MKVSSPFFYSDISLRRKSFFFFFSNCGIVGKLRPDDPDIFHGNG